MNRAAAVLVLLALLAAGCGVRSSKPYTAAGSASCLRGKGFTGVTTAAAKVGFVAATAQNGGLQARSPSGNVVTIAFAADSGSVGQTQAAVRRFASPAYRRHISDVMRTVNNAVMVWTTTPDSAELDTASRCLQH